MADLMDVLRLMNGTRTYGGVVKKIQVTRDAPPGSISSVKSIDADEYRIFMHPTDWERLEMEARATWRPGKLPEPGAPWFLAGVPVEFEAPDG